MGSYNSQSALGQYSVILSAPFLATVGAIWAVSKDCSDCSTKANYPTPECVGMVSFPVRARGRVGRTGSPNAPRMLLLLLLDSGASRCL